MNFLSLTDMCNKSSVMAVILFIKELLKILFIIVPIGLILILSIDLAKNVIAKEEEMKKNMSVFIKRIIMVVLLFFIPTIMTILTDMLNNAGVFDVFNDELATNWAECLDYSTFDNLKDLQEIDKAKEALEKEERQKKYQEEMENKRNNSSSSNYGNGSNSGSNYGSDDIPSPALSGNLIKVLLVGNSYTYYNGYPEMLMKMAKSTGKKIIVVRAGVGGKDGNELAKMTVNYRCWSSDNSCEAKYGKNKKAKLSTIIDTDFGNKGRKGSWDYVVLQNNQHNRNKVANGDAAIYNKLKGKIKSSKNFILNATYYGKSSGSGRYEQHLKYAKRNNLSVMYSSKIFSTYSSNWKKILKIGDRYSHQSGKGAYMYATILYAKIYGPSELASTESSSNFIKVYNNNGTTKKISDDNYHEGKNGRTAMTVNDKTARKIQTHVKALYSKYVNNY